MRRFAIVFCALLATLGASGMLFSRTAAASTSATSTSATESWGEYHLIGGPTGPSFGTGDATSVSCAAPGDCAAAADTENTDGTVDTVVADETGGTRGSWQVVAGTKSAADEPLTDPAVACPAAGDCVVSGSYAPALDSSEITFVASQSSGKWGTAKQIPGLYGTGADGLACWSAGNCAVLGNDATDLSAVADESGGSWGAAREVPGLAALSPGIIGSYGELSCDSAGACAVGGFYETQSSPDVGGSTTPFVAYETGGTWGDAQSVAVGPDTGTQYDSISSVACAPAGGCTAVGLYLTSGGSAGDYAPFAVSETGGAWGAATPLTLPASAPSGEYWGAPLVSCASATSCEATFSGLTADSALATWVAEDSGGTWGTAAEVPVSSKLATYGGFEPDAISCRAAGYCAIAGDDGNATGSVANEVSGTWGAAQLLTDARGGIVGSAADVACVSGDNCTLVGNSPDNESYTQWWPVRSTATTLTLSAATVKYGDEQAAKPAVTVTSASGTPAGTVSIKTGNAVVCTITLKSGKGSCTLSAKKLPVGTHNLTATYSGAAAYTASTAPEKTLKVVATSR